MDLKRKVLLLQMTTMIMSKMMTQTEMIKQKTSFNEAKLSSDQRNLSEKRLLRDISHHIDQDGRVRRFRGRQGRDKPPGDTRPILEVPSGFDLSTAERQEDGQFCVYKRLSLEGIEKVPVQQCVHKTDTQCYVSYVTAYTPATEEVCSENYSKKCYIELSKKSVSETAEKCYYPTERICNPPRDGEPPREVCQTQYETTCVTKYKETPVVENVKDCVEQCEEPLGGYGSARAGRQQQLDGLCRPVCSTVKKTVYRTLPDTVCEKIPFEACAPDNCEWVAGEAQCHNKTQDVTVDSPEEVCDLQPQKMCKQVYRLVPRLTPKEICKDIPREVCFTTLQNPRKVSTPLLTKWCFSPEQNNANNINVDIPSSPPPSAYSQPSRFPPISNEPEPDYQVPDFSKNFLDPIDEDSLDYYSPSPEIPVNQFPSLPPSLINPDQFPSLPPSLINPDQFPSLPQSLTNQDQFLDDAYAPVPGFPSELPQPQLPSQSLFPPPQYSPAPPERFRSRP